MRFFLPNQVGVRDGINGHCLLEQAIEEFPTVARLAPVETEGKFVQVVYTRCSRDTRPWSMPRSHRFSRDAT